MASVTQFYVQVPLVKVSRLYLFHFIAKLSRFLSCSNANIDHFSKERERAWETELESHEPLLFKNFDCFKQFNGGRFLKTRATTQVLEQVS